jgi:hypothetical protein
MRLIGNKEKISYIKVGNVYWKGENVWNSNNDIRYKQNIDTRSLTNSNYLIRRMYHEINRE